MIDAVGVVGDKSVHVPARGFRMVRLNEGAQKIHHLVRRGWIRRRSRWLGRLRQFGEFRCLGWRLGSGSFPARKAGASPAVTSRMVDHQSSKPSTAEFLPSAELLNIATVSPSSTLIP